MQTKERLRREVADWIKRAQHEAKNAFAERDLWSALAWGAKVSCFFAVDRTARDLPYETGMAVDVLYERVERIVKEIDPSGDIAKALGVPRWRAAPHGFHVGIDIARGPSATAIATLFQDSLERMRGSLEEKIKQTIIHTAEEHVLDAQAKGPTDDDLRKRIRESLDKRIHGKPVDFLIIDDPLKE